MLYFIIIMLLLNIFILINIIKRERWNKSILRNIFNNMEKNRENDDFIKDFILKKFFNENYIYTTKIKDDIYYFSDSITSNIVKNVSEELNCGNEYNFDNIEFKDGDVIIDIGGNIGMTSITLAKRFPFLKIYAFEPVKENYDNFIKNIELNNVGGVITVENKAVTKDRRKVNINIPIYDTACSTIVENFTTYHQYDLLKSSVFVDSLTLDDIFENYDIKECKLLKIDCEGSEYEILYNTTKKTLKKIKGIRGEFHGTIEEINSLKSFVEKNITKDYLVDLRIHY